VYQTADQNKTTSFDYITGSQVYRADGHDGIWTVHEKVSDGDLGVYSVSLKGKFEFVDGTNLVLSRDILQFSDKGTEQWTFEIQNIDFEISTESSVLVHPSLKMFIVTDMNLKKVVLVLDDTELPENLTRPLELYKRRRRMPEDVDVDALTSLMSGTNLFSPVSDVNVASLVNLDVNVDIVEQASLPSLVANAEYLSDNYPVVLEIVKLGLTYSLTWVPAVTIGLLTGSALWYGLNYTNIWATVKNACDEYKVEWDLVKEMNVAENFGVAVASWVSWNYVAPGLMKSAMESRLGTFSYNTVYTLSAPILGTLYEVFMFPIVNPDNLDQTDLYNEVYARNDALDPQVHENLMYKYLWSYLPSGDPAPNDYWGWQATNQGLIPKLAVAGAVGGIWSSQTLQMHLGIQYLISELKPYVLITPTDAWEWTTSMASQLNTIPGRIYETMVTDTEGWKWFVFTKITGIKKETVEQTIEKTLATIKLGGQISVIVGVVGLLWYFRNFNK
jgi:hypothetical protein